jgi:adenine-specific DNA-methyltransferase
MVIATKNISNSPILKRDLGQFFSPKILVDKCIDLISNKNGRLMEPSCGDGAFFKIKSKNSVFIEIDKDLIVNNNVLNMDFFEYPVTEKFDTIIGNPPYVDNSLIDIKHKTGIKVQANLYLYFIEKCFHHLRQKGELIFIVPREFIKLTSAKYVNELLCKNGTITHYYDFGDQKLFKNACPNVCIFRYEKGNYTNKTKTFNGELNCIINDGIISFVKDKDMVRVGDLFDIKVGAVSGADKFFENDENGEEFVCSKTAKTGELKKMIYQKYDLILYQYKEKLINRKIKKFNENNWYEWGRPVKFYKDKPRIYVNCKTRNKNPFFINKCNKWDGSVLALFPKDSNMNLEKAVKQLNNQDWEQSGFITGGRFCFSNKALREGMIKWNKN